MRHLMRKLWNRTVHPHTALCHCGCGRVAGATTDLSGQPMLFVLAPQCAARLFPGADVGQYMALRTLCG